MALASRSERAKRALSLLSEREVVHGESLLLLGAGQASSIGRLVRLPVEVTWVGLVSRRTGRDGRQWDVARAARVIGCGRARPPLRPGWRGRLRAPQPNQSWRGPTRA